MNPYTELPASTFYETQVLVDAPRARRFLLFCVNDNCWISTFYAYIHACIHKGEWYNDVIQLESSRPTLVSLFSWFSFASSFLFFVVLFFLQPNHKRREKGNLKEFQPKNVDEIK